MIKKFLNGLDQKYLKICIYAAVTVLLTGAIAILLMGTGPFWTKLFAIIGAVIKRRDHLLSAPACCEPV